MTYVSVIEEEVVPHDDVPDDDIDTQDTVDPLETQLDTIDPMETQVPELVTEMDTAEQFSPESQYDDMSSPIYENVNLVHVNCDENGMRILPTRPEPSPSPSTTTHESPAVSPSESPAVSPSASLKARCLFKIVRRHAFKWSFIGS